MGVGNPIEICCCRQHICKRGKKDMNLSELPKDVILGILKWLDIKELAVVALVDSSFCRLASHDVIWKEICRREGEDVSNQQNSGNGLSWKKYFEIHLREWCDFDCISTFSRSVLVRFRGSTLKNPIQRWQKDS
jgi:hypothetical protein